MDVTDPATFRAPCASYARPLFEMQRPSPITLLAAGFAAVFVTVSGSGSVVEAAGSGSVSIAEVDTDGDFLPDIVEWITLTDSSNPDTDGDQTPDFIEVIGSGFPRHESLPLPADQQLRLFVTGPTPGSSDPFTWIHVFHRIMPSGGTNPGAGAIQSFNLWLENPVLPGVQIPLNDFAAAGTVYRERITVDDGIWIQVSVPLVSMSILEAILPCTIWAETTVAGQPLQSGQQLIPSPAGAAALVPFFDGRYVIQTLSPIPALSAPQSVQVNKVCILTLDEDTSGPAGTTYVVTAADCEDANDLECDSSCSQSVGWTITIPGGTELLGGQ